MTPDEAVDSPIRAPATGPEPEFLTVAEAAALLRVADQTVRNELAARRLPGKKIGKEWRLSRTALIAYLSTPGTPRASRARGTVGEEREPSRGRKDADA
jgi:excisionase family DNA binding protein